MFDHFGYGGFAIRLTWMGKKGFAILLAADCKSAGLKEVGAFLDDGLQIRRNEIPTDFESGRIPGGMFV